MEKIQFYYYTTKSLFQNRAKAWITNFILNHIDSENLKHTTLSQEIFAPSIVF